MEPLDVTAYVLHTLFAGLWTGSILFTTYAVLPLARDGNLNAAPLQTVAGKIKTVSRASALLLFITGSHMAAARYTRETLTGTDGGYLVLSMLGLWFLLMGVVEVGAGKLTSGSGRDKVREPARESRPFFLAASALSLLLLINAGALSAHNVGLL